jgi:hypothetical protein
MIELKVLHVEFEVNPVMLDFLTTTGHTVLKKKGAELHDQKIEQKIELPQSSNICCDRLT